MDKYVEDILELEAPRKYYIQSDGVRAEKPAFLMLPLWLQTRNTGYEICMADCDVRHFKTLKAITAFFEELVTKDRTDAKIVEIVEITKGGKEEVIAKFER